MGAGVSIFARLGRGYSRGVSRRRPKTPPRPRPSPSARGCETFDGGFSRGKSRIRAVAWGDATRGPSRALRRAGPAGGATAELGPRRPDLEIQILRCLGEVLEERRTEPSLGSGRSLLIGVWAPGNGAAQNPGGQYPLVTQRKNPCFRTGFSPACPA